MRARAVRAGVIWARAASSGVRAGRGKAGAERAARGRASEDAGVTYWLVVVANLGGGPGARARGCGVALAGAWQQRRPGHMDLLCRALLLDRGGYLAFVRKAWGDILIVQGQKHVHSWLLLANSLLLVRFYC